MTAKDFPESNVKIAEHQEEYQTLPAKVSPDGTVVCCFELSDEEKKRVAETGEIWLGVLTFCQPLQPIQLSTLKEELIISEDEVKNG